MTSYACRTFPRFFTMPCAAFVIIAAALGALAFAFTMQYRFNVQPCVLCLWQRVPFGLAAALAVAAYISKPYGSRSRVLIALCAAAFLANTGLAIFHTGVERHWWEGTRGCHGAPLSVGASVEDLRHQIMNATVGHCDEISWTFFGFSMANWNIPFCLALAIFAALAAVFQGCRQKL